MVLSHPANIRSWGQRCKDIASALEENYSIIVPQYARILDSRNPKGGVTCSVWVIQEDSEEADTELGLIG